ncbi:MAG: QacE family quaternary ammonium compound efflux SMR transporter, partial [Desulfovibrio sp.]|nr:QacE family quaternary ammonium compound efflux SMR transporter [Desulfovibrio sp.]
MGKYVLLFLAIISETVGTSFLKESDGFTRLWPSVVTLAGYALSF